MINQVINSLFYFLFIYLIIIILNRITLDTGITTSDAQIHWNSLFGGEHGSRNNRRLDANRPSELLKTKLATI